MIIKIRKNKKMIALEHGFDIIFLILSFSLISKLEQYMMIFCLPQSSYCDHKCSENPKFISKKKPPEVEIISKEVAIPKITIIITATKNNSTY
jgi:hypothetical protein